MWPTESLVTRANTKAHFSREVRFGVVGHASAPEPSLIGMRCLELQYMRQHRSSPRQETRFEVIVHVTAPEPHSTGRWGPKLQDTWQCWSPHIDRGWGPELQNTWQYVDTRHAPRLNLKSICEGSRSAGTNKLYITFSSSIKKLAQLSAWPHISNFSGRYSLEYAVNVSY
jgi:hypothetical protein